MKCSRCGTDKARVYLNSPKKGKLELICDMCYRLEQEAKVKELKK